MLTLLQAGMGPAEARADSGDERTAWTIVVRTGPDAAYTTAIPLSAKQFAGMLAEASAIPTDVMPLTDVYVVRGHAKSAAYAIDQSYQLYDYRTHKRMLLTN